MEKEKGALRQCSIGVLLLGCLIHLSSAYEKTLIDFANNFDIASVGVNDAQVALVTTASGKALRVTFGNQAQKPSIAFSSSGWDLSTYINVTMRIRNEGAKDVAIMARLNTSDWINGIVILNPGETQLLTIVLKRLNPPAYITNYLTGMNGLPGGYVKLWNEAINVNRITVYEIMPKENSIIDIDSVEARDLYAPPDEQTLKTTFFPFIDTFGQYNHQEWPGKTHTTGDIKAQYLAEQTDIANNPGPQNWDQYGGYLKGPKLAATGHFRTEKYQGKWWLVDPDGYLFWSAGIDCIGSGDGTPTSGRENYFTVIASGGNFYQANLQRKYGSNWSALSFDFTHNRLRSWGINTFGNWSNQSMYLLRKTPYTVAISSNGVPAATSNNSAFRTALNTRLTAEVGKSASDPWCIGYFVDNEIHDWGDGTQTTIETYYRSVNEEIKKVAPNKLYLGSRLDFHDWSGTGTQTEVTIVRAAAKYCDIVSFNRYQFTANDLIMPSDVDKPIIIGEFHWGALDRGLPHTGLRSVGNQEQRGRAYEYYITTALDNPNMVGAHWFQYVDQPYTGRSDGENYQIGFVDVCDKPYPEITGASRQVNYSLYEYRLNGTGVAWRMPFSDGSVGKGSCGPQKFLVSSGSMLKCSGKRTMLTVYDLHGRLLRKVIVQQGAVDLGKEVGTANRVVMVNRRALN